jgi:protein-tyrosine phosphatase
MFFFGKKKEKKEQLDLSWLGTDMHSHLVPGIDDGSPDITASVAMIKGLAELGYKKVITTPHILWEIYPNTSDRIIQGLEEVRTALQQEGVNIDLHAAAEYYMDEHFEEEIQKKAPLLCIKDNMVLVEFSMVTAPFDLQRILFDLQMQGYQPVLAHPERYTYLNGRRSVYEDLKTAGCYFQLNLLSLTGYYGRAVQDIAEYLVKNKYYDFAGTDMHHDRHLATLQKLSASPYYKEIQELGLKNREL